MKSSAARQKRSRIFVVAFVLLIIALSVLATVLIQSGRQDAEFQEELQELREEGR
jgi:t-SNARE complex subunit (syntaxin)